MSISQIVKEIVAKNNERSENVKAKKTFTKKDVATGIGVSVRTLEGWEAGRNPSRSARILLQELRDGTRFLGEVVELESLSPREPQEDKDPALDILL